MRSIAIIPARLGSSRLPRKPLLEIGGLPLVEHVRRRCSASKCDRVVVACEEQEIADAVRRHGGEAVVTGPAPSGTHRVALALSMIQEVFDVVVNVQGDQPLLEPAHLDVLLDQISECASFATLIAPFPEGEDPADPSLVKVVLDQSGSALYFSRAPIPFGGPWWIHLGLYAFTPNALQRFVSLPSGPLTDSEDLEQLRWIESGLRVAVGRVDHAPAGVDTLKQFHRLRDRYRAGQFSLPTA